LGGGFERGVDGEVEKELEVGPKWWISVGSGAVPPQSSRRCRVTWIKTVGEKRPTVMGRDEPL
jgi:hypothetical protein